MIDVVRALAEFTGYATWAVFGAVAIVFSITVRQGRRA